MDRDDFLLAQIDEFREKAKELQEILVTKESKAQELQTIVKEREDKADELQQILDERQGKVDGIEAEVAKQIDQLIVRVNAKMDEIEQSMGGQMENFSKTITGEMTNLSRNVSAEVNSLGRNINDNLQGIEDSFGGTVDKTSQIVREQSNDVKQVVDSVNQSSAQMLESLSDLNDQLAVGHQHGGGNDVEQGVAQSDTGSINGCIVECKLQECIQNQIHRQNDQRAQHIDQGVHDGNALCAGVGTDTGNNSRDTGTDVLTHDDRNCRTIRYLASHSKRLKDTYRCRR